MNDPEEWTIPMSASAGVRRFVPAAPYQSAPGHSIGRQTPRQLPEVYGTTGREPAYSSARSLLERLLAPFDCLYEAVGDGLRLMLEGLKAVFEFFEFLEAVWGVIEAACLVVGAVARIVGALLIMFN